jgi:hypothetical protein
LTNPFPACTTLSAARLAKDDRSNVRIYEAIVETSRITLILVLRDVTESKIFVEIERACLTQLLVQYLESRGNPQSLTKALTLLQDMRLEGLTTLTSKERIRLMLHQFRLCVDTGDSLRAAISSERIPDIKEPDPELQTEFLNLDIQYYSKFRQVRNVH